MRCKGVFSAVMMVVLCGLWLSSCGHSGLGKMVGADRDDHGCLASAGYTWSEALHQCVRLWEAGTRVENGSRAVYLVFDADSLRAEIFLPDGGSVLCKRQAAHANVWEPRRGTERIWVSNGVLCVKTSDATFTRGITE